VIPDRVTLRLGPLRIPIAKRLDKTGQKLSDYIRILIANDLKEAVPVMLCGQAGQRQYQLRNVAFSGGTKVNVKRKIRK